MKSRNFLLHSLALELARVSEMLRQREPKTAEACEALLGIRRQLAAASGQGYDSAPRDAAAPKNTRAGKNARSSHGSHDSNHSTHDSNHDRHDSNPGSLPAARQSAKKPRHSRKQLLEQLISDTERLTLMLVSEQAAGEAASETFAEFRQAVVASAGERRKHLTDLSYLHSLSVGASETQPIVAELEDMFRRAGGTIVADYSEEHKADFDVSGSGQTIRVLRPAYIAANADGRTMLVARGHAEGIKASTVEGIKASTSESTMASTAANTTASTAEAATEMSTETSTETSTATGAEKGAG